MPRVASGSVYKKRGKWFVAFSLPKKKHFHLLTCMTEGQAEATRTTMRPIKNTKNRSHARVAVRLRSPGEGLQE
jgi:hypothetical protein